jgi:hypothetical protein
LEVGDIWGGREDADVGVEQLVEGCDGHDCAREDVEGIRKYCRSEGLSAPTDQRSRYEGYDIHMFNYSRETVGSHVLVATADRLVIARGHERWSRVSNGRPGSALTEEVRDSRGGEGRAMEKSPFDTVSTVQAMYKYR